MEQLPQESLDPTSHISRRHFLGLSAAVCALPLIRLLPWCGEKNPPPVEVADCSDTPVTMEHKEINGTADLLGEPWNLAGVERRGNGLHIKPVNTLVLNPDGTYQSMFPMNEYGVRLEANGDVAMELGCSLGNNSRLALELDSQLPLEYDDFVLRRGGVRMTIGQNEVTGNHEVVVQRWIGPHQQPEVQPFPLSDSASQKALSIKRQGNQVFLSVNGQELGVIATGILPDGPIWMGLQAQGAACDVTKLTVTETGGSAAIVNTATITVGACKDGLAALAKRAKHARPDFRIGTAVALAPLVSDSKYAALLSNFDRLTTENVLKARDVQPEEGVFTFEAADALVDFATRHGMELWGHNLVWYKELPKWMAELPTDNPEQKARVQQVMVDHLTTVMRRYRGVIKYYDVFNEILANRRDSPWFKAMGNEDVAIAFAAAHAADPDAELWLNEYGIDKDTDEARFQIMLQQVIKGLKDRRIRVDGLGFEGHVYEIPRDSMSPSALKSRFQQLAKVGLKARVSEMDVTTAKGPEVQAAQFADILRVCLEQPNCTGFSMWGIGGPYVSTSSLSGDKFTSSSNLPWDEELNQRPAYAAMKKVLQ